MRCEKADETVSNCIGAPPPPQLVTPAWAQWGHLGNSHNTFHSSATKVSRHKIYLYNLTVLLLDLEKMLEIYMVVALKALPKFD